MKTFVALLLLAITATSAYAGRVKGYFKKDGTYVQPHHRSNPNSSKADNYSSEGRFNPYTGKEGKTPVWSK